ncbi:MAG: DUF2232 domain-containing protein [Gammaproteobacteria bacterium]|nr:DUF2232 domain-containing protein [Gammaproteobacteria bacterium]
MQALGKYILSGRMQAIGAVSFLSTLSLLFLPLAFLFSGVPIGLLTLRKGATQCAQLMLGSFLLMCLLSALLKIQFAFVVMIAGCVWLPVYFCSLVLRETQRPALMSLFAGGIALSFVVYMHLAIGDVEEWWRNLLNEALASGLPAGTSAQYQQAIELAPALMNAMVASSITMSLIITVLIARWWQSRLFNPGGFSLEFRAFTLPRPLVFPLVLGMGLLFFEGLSFASLLRDLLIIALVLYLFQGLATVHRTVKERHLSRSWLTAMYLLLAFVPQLMVIFVAWIGMTDSLLNRRGSPPADEAG